MRCCKVLVNAKTVGMAPTLGPWRVEAGSFVIEVAQLVLLHIFCHLLVGPTPTNCIYVNKYVPTNILRPFLITTGFVCQLRSVANKPYISNVFLFTTHCYIITIYKITKSMT